MYATIGKTESEAEFRRRAMTHKDIQHLICCCCGAETRGRQWHNRDTGYGLCDRCIDLCRRKMTAADMQSCYGIRGVHYDLPDKESV